MTILDPRSEEEEAPSAKWTGDRVAFITEQYLLHRKSAVEIARMLGRGFSRNAVTGKLFRTGALRARSGIGLGSHHGLPKGDTFKPRRKRKEGSPSAESARPVEAPHEIEPRGAALVQSIEDLFDIDGIALIDAEADHCRWPAKSVHGAAHVCGARKTRGAYCEKHAAIAYRSRGQSSSQARPPDRGIGPARGKSGATPFGEAS